MTRFDGVQLKIKNFKSFGPDGGGFSAVRRINIVIGRNNSGKSALIDLVQRACCGGAIDRKHFHRGRTPELVLTVPMSEAALRRVFQEHVSGGPIPGPNHWNPAGQSLVGKPITIRLEDQNKLVDIETTNAAFWENSQLAAYFENLAQLQGSPFRGLIFRRVGAERDVTPEVAVSRPAIESNGVGLTATIAFYINRADQPSDLVEQEMRGALNKIFAPDAIYSNIIIQQVADEKWEVYLIEESGERIALSDSGSGLKTILHVLACLILVPHFENKRPNEYVFAFEELENNLHPALQRRLFAYIADWMKEKDATVFVTTHSNVVIDMFASDAEASITHVMREAGIAKARPVDTYVAGRELLEDLDVRASDLLQANGLVWLEGPSDRIYFNHWISLESDGLLREGTHYQCVYYGGKLLAHLSGETPDAAPEELVATLRVNKNALILMDSDRRSDDGRTVRGKINATKRRIEDEFERVNALAVITDGKEIENYIPHSTLRKLFGSSASELGQFDDIGDYLEANEGAGAKKRFESNKVGFARKVVSQLDAEDFRSVGDLRTLASKAVSTIRRWNNL